VHFNRKFNPDKAKEGDYNVIARGATSLMAKEVRGIQLDSMAQSLSEEDKAELDTRKFLLARLKVRDLDDMMITEDESKRRQQSREQAQQAQQAQQTEQIEANIRLALSNAFKNISQGQKNAAAADAAKINAALDVLDAGMDKDAQSETGSRS
jgi:hypothetical protein